MCSTSLVTRLGVVHGSFRRHRPCCLRRHLWFVVQHAPRHERRFVVATPPFSLGRSRSLITHRGSGCVRVISSPKALCVYPLRSAAVIRSSGVVPLTLFRTCDRGPLLSIIPLPLLGKAKKNCGRFCVSCVSLWNPPFKYGSFMYERANELDDNRSGPSRYVCFHLSTDLLISYVSLTSLKILLDRVSKAWMAVDVSMCVGLIGLSGKLVVCERETCVSSARGSCVRKHVGERARSTNLSSVSSFTLPTLLKTKKLCPRHSMLSCSRRGRTR